MNLLVKHNSVKKKHKQNIISNAVIVNPKPLILNYIVQPQELLYRLYNLERNEKIKLHSSTLLSHRFTGINRIKNAFSWFETMYHLLISHKIILTDFHPSLLSIALDQMNNKIKEYHQNNINNIQNINNNNRNQHDNFIPDFETASWYCDEKINQALNISTSESNLFFSLNPSIIFSVKMTPDQHDLSFMVHFAIISLSNYSNLNHSIMF